VAGPRRSPLSGQRFPIRTEAENGFTKTDFEADSKPKQKKSKLKTEAQGFRRPRLSPLTRFPTRIPLRTTTETAPAWFRSSVERGSAQTESHTLQRHVVPGR